MASRAHGTRKRGQSPPAPKRIVEVSWRDAAKHGGWSDLDELRTEGPEEITSVGYLLDADRHRLLLLQSQDRRPEARRQGSDTLAIPRDWVQRVRTVGRRG